jgi:YesN/AraC family two-component response regulator
MAAINKPERLPEGTMVRKSILLVEDDTLVRDMIKGALVRKYDVLEASMYSDAINQIRNPIDLALIDYVLPDRDGFELLKTIREEKPALPVIMMTAYGNETMVINAFRKGVTDYLKKPLSIKYLMRKVSEILGEKDDNGHFENAGNRNEFIMDGIATYMEEKYMEDLTRKKMANMARMHRNKFCKVFKNKFGKTFTSYLNHIRIKNAAGLLENPDLNITEIAFFVGYRNIVHFERVFREVYGISPREYRRSMNDRNPSLSNKSIEGKP